MKKAEMIKSQTASEFENLLKNVFQTQLILISEVELLTQYIKGEPPQYLTIEEASKKYQISEENINNQIKLFEKLKGRPIDSVKPKRYNLVRESQLKEAIEFKTISTKGKRK